MDLRFFNTLLLAAALLNANCIDAQKNNKNKSTQNEHISDVNTPLHLLKPQYKIDYSVPTAESVKDKMDLLLNFIDVNTPTGYVDDNGNPSDKDHLTTHSHIKQGTFRLTTYEWGVVYEAMLAATKVTDDNRFKDYAIDRMHFLCEASDAFRQLMDSTGHIETTVRQLIEPHALDDCGAICNAMLKAKKEYKTTDFDKQIDVYFNHLFYDQYRLGDGTLARHRPQRNTVWLDDMYMGIPSMAMRARTDNEPRYCYEALRQVRLFKEKMWVASDGLFRHGWVASATYHPSFYWARANGWAMLTLTEVLDALTANKRAYGQYIDEVKSLLVQHIESISRLQDADGFWHQLLDRNDTYEETSATAIFTYCIAHAINKNWIDADAFGATAINGWNAVNSMITSDGHIEGTCVGTGMAFDAAFYAHRPVSSAAAHGYGPALLAATETFALVNNYNVRLNDSAIHLYDKAIRTDNSPIFSVPDPERPLDLIAGETRQKGKKVVFIIGDSTVKNGYGKGDLDQWGWASFYDMFIDTTKATVENHAIGGRSSRSFINEGRWTPVRDAIHPGDILIVQFGHNDGGSYSTGRARASIDGTDETSIDVCMQRNGREEKVFTFGHYLRTYIRQAKDKGAIVVILSPTPRNVWTDGRIDRYTDTYDAWAQTVAEEENVFFVDANNMIADAYDNEGEGCKDIYFKDSVHTSREGAMKNCEVITEGLRNVGLGNIFRLPETK